MATIYRLKEDSELGEKFQKLIGIMYDMNIRIEGGHLEIRDLVSGKSFLVQKNPMESNSFPPDTDEAFYTYEP